MKRLFLGSLIVSFIGAAWTPANSDAGIFSRRSRCSYSASPSVTVQPSPVYEQAQAPEGYRRYSYEPSQPIYSAPPSRSYGTQGRKKSPWDYPKTDPRRYDF